MRNLLNFLLKYNNLIVFLVLEGIALSWLTTGNSYHNSRIVRGMQGITRGIQEKITNTRSYLSLKDVNSRLALENADLKNTIQRFSNKTNLRFVPVKDTNFKQQYQYISARVINNSVNKQKNFFTIDKGRAQGIKADMAVTSGDNVAGVIIGCSQNYSVAISLLNIDFRVSARIKSNGYFGSLSWDGKNYRHAILNEIPQHIIISVGDTIETTGYSAIFPEGISIGTISDFRKSGSDFYRITVELFTDFRKLSYLKVIGNLKRTEQIELERKFQ
ncbi:MAG: rod shape-determining protein MreC [Bacteroidota bacterium]|nr:rod shape-determining protein MreC [Bacteroidota bacterium]